VICSVAILVGISAPVASAHLVATDGTMGAILHINPEDYPVTNIPQQLVFYYSSLSDFKPMNCTCTLTISQAGTQISQQVLAPRYTKSALADVTFKYPAVYQIKLSGAPINGATFTPFNLDYSVAVHTSVPGEMAGGPNWNKPVPKKTYESHLMIFTVALLGAAATLIAIASYLIYNIQKKSKGDKKSVKKH
jgi:hypothetical protein